MALSEQLIKNFGLEGLTKRQLEVIEKLIRSGAQNDEKISEYKFQNMEDESRPKWDDRVAAVNRGFSLGASDNLQAFVQSLFPGQPSYSERLGQLKDREAVVREQEPWTTGGLEMLGGIAPSIALNPAFRTAMPAASPSRVAYTQGMTEGGVHGGLSADLEPLGQVALETTGGVVGGGVGTALGQGVGGLLQTAADRAPSNKATAIVRKRLHDDLNLGRNMPVTQAATRELGEIGPGGLLSDVGPNTRGAAWYVANTPSSSRREFSDTFTERQVKLPEKTREAYMAATGSRDDLWVRQQELKSQKQTQARENYRAAKEIPVNATVLPDEILVDPIALKAFRDAEAPFNREKMLEGSEYRIKLPHYDSDNPELFLDYVKSINDLGFWDTWQKQVSDMTKPGSKNDFSDYQKMNVRRTVHEPVVKEFVEQTRTPEGVSLYGVAREDYKFMSDLEEAGKLGQKLFEKGTDIDQAVNQISNMTPAEKKEYLIGALSVLKTRTGSTTETGQGALTEIKKPNYRAKLKAAMNNDEMYDDFMRRIEGLRRQFETYQTSVGNSKTVERFLESQNMSGTTNLLGNIASGNFGQAGNDVISLLQPKPGTLSDDTIATMARLLGGDPSSALAEIERRGVVSPPLRNLINAILQSGGRVAGTETAGLLQ
jgi:hypothetical protein